MILLIFRIREHDHCGSIAACARSACSPLLALFYCVCACRLLCATVCITCVRTCSVYSSGMGSKGQLGHGDMLGRSNLTPIARLCGRGVCKVVAVCQLCVIACMPACLQCTSVCLSFGPIGQKFTTSVTEACARRPGAAASVSRGRRERRILLAGGGRRASRSHTLAASQAFERMHMLFCHRVKT